LDAIAEWAEKTTDGSLADIGSPPRPEVWDEIAAEPDLCTKSACPHYGKCFLFQARRTAANADVVVVNHHLLMSDVAVRRVQQNWEDAAVIPAYSRLVVDEAHHMEEAASAHLGTSATRRGLQQLFSRLLRHASGPRRGLLPALKMKLAALLGRRKAVFFVAKFNKEDIEVLRELLEAGTVKPVIDRRFGLSEIADAFRYLGEGHARGKVVIADGYHRLCAVYAGDEDASIPCKLA